MEKIKNNITTLLKDKNENFVLLKTDYKTKEEIFFLTIFLGKDLGKSCGYKFLVENEKLSSQKMPIHKENIYTGEGDYFALACIEDNFSNGETRLFDAHKTALDILKEKPDFKNIKIEYRTNAYKKNNKKIRNLIEFVDEKPILVYRSKVYTNKIINNLGYNENDIYNYIESILEKNIIIEHKWEKGDILFVNNKFTLHDRLAYSGNRELLRVRFDDIHNKNIIF